MRFRSIVSRMSSVWSSVWSPSLALLVAAAVTAPLAACGDPSGPTPVTPSTEDSGTTDAGADVAADSGACPTTGTGSLEVTVVGLPAGVAGKVTVEGAPVVTATSTSSLAGGTHAVSAAVVTSTDPIVRAVYKPTVSAASVCVKADSPASVTVTYEKIASSNALWLTHGNGTGEVASIAGSGLAATGSVASSGFTTGLPSAASNAFDRDGNLWTTAGSGEVRRFRAADLGAAGTLTPDVTLTSAEFSAAIPGPGPIALDKAGDLWIGLVAQQKIVKIPAASANAGNAAPTVVLEGTWLDGLGSLAFDKAGNLFVSANERVHRYDVARLAASSTAAPELTLEAKTPAPVIGTLGGPSSLAFDATGNLWVSYFAANVIARLTPAEINATGTTSITPAIQITIAVTVLLEEIAFDESGGLWLTYSTGKVARLAPSQLGANGDVTPQTVVTASGLGSSKGVAFFPAAAGLPLYSALP